MASVRPALQDPPLPSRLRFQSTTASVCVLRTRLLIPASPLMISYSTFIPLYPLGASSEAFLSLSTLPPLSTLPASLPPPLSDLAYNILALKPLTNLIDALPLDARGVILQNKFGRNMVWKLATLGAGLRAGGGRGRKWGVEDLVKGAQFLVWWPCELTYCSWVAEVVDLAYLFGHMMRLRKKVVGRGKTVDQTKKAQ